MLNKRSLCVGFKAPGDHFCASLSRLLICLALVVIALPPEGANADLPFYERRDTWQETMLATREAMLREGRTLGDETRYLSSVVRGGKPARQIRVPISGLKELYLFVTGSPNVTYGAATWADPQLIGKDGSVVRLCHLDSLKVLEGRHDIDRNLKSGVSGPLKIAGKEFKHGVHVYANSKIRIRLERSYEWLEAWIGIDDWVGEHGAVRFRVTGPGGAQCDELWRRLNRDFPAERQHREMQWERNDHLLMRDWKPGDYGDLAQRYANACGRVPDIAEQATELSRTVNDVASLDRVRQLYYLSREANRVLQRAKSLDFRPLRMAIADLTESFGQEYPAGSHYAEQLEALKEELSKSSDFERVTELIAQFDQLKQQALLANPLMDIDRLLLIKRVPDGDPRRPNGKGYGLGEFIGTPRQSSKSNPNIERPFNWDNEISVLSPVRPDGKITTLYQSEDKRLITDMDLHWNGDKLLFSMPGTHDKWHVFEIGADGQGLRQLSPTDQADIHCYDSCYLPNDDIAFVSTAPLQGVPCNTGVIVGMMYMMNADGKNVRQVCFEQDHTYCPTVMNDGRILYLRWDYTDTPHVWNRILFSMNPDGTGQAHHYGSNSYWPNSVFFTRPIPNDPSKFVGIVTGHHVGRTGELVVFDPARGTHEADGVVQRIPGYGKKVEPLIQDKLTEHSWPKFTHPYPLSDKYFLVSCKLSEDSLWGIYLADVFDNLLLIKELEGHALVEPMPLRPTVRPPIIPSRIDPEAKDATVYLRDIYSGPGLKDVPRGEVKKLRLFTYHFAYQKQAGITHRVGADGPWEVKRVLGTVPVEADGSAMFRIPAKTPISIQPLDADGQALALMRSWMTAMPGETISCTGCHDAIRSTPTAVASLAVGKHPTEIKPWHGPVRGFSFQREVQPVLDKHCVGCHNGTPPNDGGAGPDLRRDQGYHVVFRGGDPKPRHIKGIPKRELVKQYNGVFEPSYMALRRLVRVGGLESDLHQLPPLEFHASTSELIQMLQKGHHNVQLDEDAWDRLITWIDLNAPCHGTWSEFAQIPGDQRERRNTLRRLYGGVDEDGETLPVLNPRPIKPIMPEPLKVVHADPPKCPDWPFDAAEAGRRQRVTETMSRTVDLGEGVTMDLVRIPAGDFIMGDNAGHPDELPQRRLTIAKPFWMSKHEVTNAQYSRFNPQHDSRFEHRTSWIFSEDYLGWPLNGPRQPVVRVSWNEANGFCRWLSQRTGSTVTLPSETEWEYACRAGTATPLAYGDLNSDFSTWANMADSSIRDLAYEGWRPKPPDILPRDARFDDRSLVTANVGSYRANAWGLHDMHGNVAEWTRTARWPNGTAREQSQRVVRGGSWYDRPKRCRSSYRLSYAAYQKVFNVGFRVCLPADAHLVTSSP